MSAGADVFRRTCELAGRGHPPHRGVPASTGKSPGGSIGGFRGGGSEAKSAQVPALLPAGRGPTLAVSASCTEKERLTRQKRIEAI